ncbi:MAG TPA: M43 family zinc metalloprotease [Fluviicola sp.]|nr:M43 family zinc metalloprotease [Fluviicola sp.]
MKKHALMLSACVLLCSQAFSQGSLSNQTISPQQETEKCSQHIRMAEMMQHDPQRYATIVSGPETHDLHYTPPGPEKITGLVYTIPVVFHVLHNNGSENISNAQILDALAILNRDYRKLNADAANVQAVFAGMPADAEIEFKLATVAPNGNCFDGITRTVSTLTNDGSDGQAQIQAIINGNNVYQGIWAHNKYLNIYVANDIGGAAGYTFLPNGNSVANLNNMYYNGIFILHDYCGSIGTGSVGTSRALTHEVGHWLNLPHVWGNGNNPGNAASCSIDDGVQDTPNCIGVTSCNLNSNTCNSDDAYWGFAMKDNVENYMDYSYCSKMYTQGQVDKMRLALTSSVGGRSNIWTNANLQAVGAIPGTSLCAIDFSASQTTVCAGTTVTYTPNTTAGISAWSWSFPGGTPATSTVSNPTVTYNTAGTYNATLTVTSSSNGLNYSEAKTSYITVNTNSPSALPLTEGFTTATFPPTGWTIVNANASNTWARSTTVGRAPTAGNSMVFDNYNINDSGNDEMRLKALNLAGMGSAQLVFDVAYAPYNATSYDGLEVLVSTNCGATWTSVYLKSNTTLATAPAVAAQFTPTAAQWRGETVSLTPYAGQSSVVVAFRNLAGYGNRLFIDNINITGVAAGPVASFTASPSTVCTGQTVTVTDGSTNATSWSWNFGAGATPATATGVGPHNVTYATAGTKTIQLTINGSTSTTQNVTVNATPATPTISAGGPTTFCSGGSVVLTSSSATGNVWSTGATTQSITVSTSGTYTVAVTSGGCTSATSAGTTVTVNPTPSAPTITPGGPTTFCSGGNVVLTSSAASGNTWSTGATTQSITVPTSGTYTVTTASGGCTSPASAGITVTVNPTPSAPTISASGPLTFCAGGSVVLTSSSATGNLWSTGATTQSITVTASGTYTVTRTSGGCTSAASAGTTVTVNPVPAAPTISAGGPTTFCAGGNVVLTSSSASGNVWSTGATTQSITVSTSGTYTVNVTASGCTSANSTGTAITVTPLPATPTISAGGPTTFCAGGSVVLTSSGASGNTWSNGATTQSITVSTPGTYTVNVTASGCTSANSAGTAIVVNALPVIAAGTVTNPTSCGSSTGSIQLTGSGTGTISWSGTSSGTLNSVTLPATINSLAAGSYSVTFTNASGCVSNTVSQGLSDPTPPATPAISAGGPTTFCSGGDVVLTSSSATGNTWSTGETTQSITVSTPGSYAVTFTNGSGCSATSSAAVITVNPTPVVSTGTVINPTSCGSSTGSIELNGSGSGTISWSGSSSGSMNGVTLPASVTNLPAGSYNITFTSAAGCVSNSLSQALTDPTPPATPTISADGATTICAGDDVVLTSSSASGNLWSTGATTQSITVSAAGNYTVTFTNANGCSATSSQTPVTVNPLPAVTFGALSDMCDYNAAVTLTQGSPAGGTYSGNGVSGSSFDPAVAGLGTTTITYNYTDGNGCSASATSDVFVGDCASLEEAVDLNIVIFPNPSPGIISVEPNGADISAIAVYDYAGRLVFREKVSGMNGPKTIDLSNLAEGVYNVRVIAGSSVVNTPVVINR